MSRPYGSYLRTTATMAATLASLAVLCAVSTPARAAESPVSGLGTPCTTAALWSFQTAQGFLPASVSGAPYGLDLVFVSAGTIFYAYWAEELPGPGGHLAGEIEWQVNAPQGIVFQNDPVIANLSFARGVVLLSTTSEGRVICLDAETGIIRWLSQRVRRPECGDDTIIATPAVQLWDFSNAAFRAAITNDDLVIVATRYECSATTENRVYAFNASDGTTRWVFNDPQTVDMGFGVEGAAIDYATNTVYLGTDQPAGAPTQHTVWAIDTRNSALKWSDNFGAIHSRTQHRGGRVYAGNTFGVLFAINGANGVLHWSLDLTPASGVGITRDLWAEFRPGAFQNRVLALDANGVLRCIVDDGVTPPLAPLWTTSPGPPYSSLGAVAPTLGKIYAGRNDGTIQQLSYSTGLSDAFTIAKAGAAVSMAALDSVGGDGAPNRMNGSAGGRVRRYCVPWSGAVDVGPGGDGTLEGVVLESAPNPFTGSTRLSYRLTSAAEVKLAVHDAQGRRVRTVEEGRSEAGPHSVEWDGRDGAGSRVPAGIYFARLMIDGAPATKKADCPLVVLH